MNQKSFFISLTAFFLIVLSTQSNAKNIAANSSNLFFIENKGQITDQHYQPRNDIQYALHAPGINIFIGNGGLHYQFSKTKIKYPDLPGKIKKELAEEKEVSTLNEDLATTETYRMDVELEGANMNAEVIASEPEAYYENYYLPGCPENGTLAHTCNKITYKNIYKGIDWVIYLKNNKLEYEFVVGPTGNKKDIRLKYSGQSSLSINAEGSIIATTPMGTITEHAPVCYSPDGTVIQSAYRLNNNVIDYETGKHRNIIIDPVLEWGTYYGPDSNNTTIYATTCDGSGNIYSSGLTYAPTGTNVATTGSYQDVYGGGCDAFLVKFDSSGNRIWGTYYGGTGGDWGVGVAWDHGVNIYLAGVTQSSLTNIASAGAQQTVYGGGLEDGFVVRFNTAGVRLWGTYLGGTGAEIPGSVVCDLLGHVYIGGFTTGTNNIATPGSFQPAKAGGYDDFLVQYDSMGVRQWGTYYGGNNSEFAGIACSDGYYVYLSGYTSSPTGISTPGVQQAALGGGTDAFLAKFNSAGARDWGTYIGGSDAESMGGITCDNAGYIYVFGSTGSDTGIATPGSFQLTRGGMTDAFLVKFNPDLGRRIWGTYFGGPDAENTDMSRIVCDNLGNVYVTGFTASTSGITSAGAWQPAFAGGAQDAFLAKFNSIGHELWSTYYGGTMDDEARACAFDGANVYIAGYTNSNNGIATPGSFLDSGGGATFYYQCFLAKFLITDVPDPTLGTGTYQPAAENISIFPNPNRGSFTLKANFANENGVARYSITDMAGRYVMDGETDIIDGNLNQQLKLTHSSPGVYLLKIVLHDKVNMVQFVVEP